METLHTLGKQAKTASRELALLEAAEKNTALLLIASTLEEEIPMILEKNQLDIAKAKENGVNEIMIDRLLLNEERIREMANGIRQIAALDDPIGQVEKMWRNEANLLIGKQKVPLGVVGIIYESRPNVTTDAAALCFKTGNAVILRGGKEAFHSNQYLVTTIQSALTSAKINPHAIQFVADPSRESALSMMTMNEYLDVLIPRGGKTLIESVVQNATVPIIETGTGNCHIYVDKEAQLDMAYRIVLNAKCQRPSVCNAMETLLVHKEIAPLFLQQLEQGLLKQQVEIRADVKAQKLLSHAIPAVEEDWSTEFLDYTLAVKVVDSLDEAIQHINHYNTKHSESIITDNYFSAQRFLQEVDAAAVYVNASTRFTDGFVFGFGAEIGISTQKLHARGPMGLEALTSSKYIIYGNGQIRE